MFSTGQLANVLWWEGRGIVLDKEGQKVAVLTAVFACVSAVLWAKGGGPPLLSMQATTPGTEVSWQHIDTHHTQPVFHSHHPFMCQPR